MTSYKYDFSVMMITYNHEDFLEEALESIRQQHFAGTYEIVIGIDKSSDQTKQVSRDFKVKHQDLNIVLLEYDQNIGMYANYCQTMRACSGKYIATLEGDDFWTNIQKLNTHYTYFEEHPDCILSGGYSIIVDKNSQIIRNRKLSNWSGGIRYFKEDLILANRFSALTVAFRADRINWSLLEQLKGSPHLDWPFYLSLDISSTEYMFKFNQVMGAYRMHDGGVYSLVNIKKKLINTAKTVYVIKSIIKHQAYEKYLSALHTNLIRLERKSIDSSIKYLYEPALDIYRGNWIKAHYLSDLSYNALQFLFKGNDYLFQFKCGLELIRQTKPSILNYLQLVINPFIVIGLLKMHFNKLLHD